MPTAPLNIDALLARTAGKPTELLSAHINPAFAKVLRTVGFDMDYVRGEGAYLWDREGHRYIDCLSGYGVFAIGRNHPVVRQALIDTMERDLPNLLKFGGEKFAGLLAEKLISVAPSGLDTVYFCNSGAEGCETAMKYARAATGRDRIVYCKKGYHGLTYGALSVNGGSEFRDGFGALLPGTSPVAFNDLNALENELKLGGVAGVIVEPIQGKGVTIADDDYLPGVQTLCREYGALFIADEVQTGIGRTGKLFACEHWGVTPDILVTSKALSGGYIPVAAVLSRRSIHNKVFSSMDRCVVHSTTFGQNDLAMVAGLATLYVIEQEKLIENAAEVGCHLMEGLKSLVEKYDLVKEVRGKGLLVGIEFGPPESLRLKPSWEILHKLGGGLWPQAVLMPLIQDHRILAQVAGHNMDVIKLIPSLVLTKQDVDEILRALDTTIDSLHNLKGAAWEVGKRLSTTALA